jgi:hypothetical protein
MSNGQRTDYLPPELYAAHANWARFHGTGFFSQILSPLMVSFNSNFDIFAANTAFAIRHYVVYRSDGGQFARGLVRDSGNLLKIWHELKRVNTPEGMQIKLVAMLWRRKDVDPTRRWSMTIEFRISSTRADVDDGDQIVVPANVISNAQQAAIEKVIHDGIMITQRPIFKGNRGHRIRGMLKIADGLGYPNNWNLWYYSRRAVYLYVLWNTTEPQRKRMSAATLGKFPFDGDNGPPEHVPWRIYPFQNAVRKCNPHASADDCGAIIARELVNVEDEILREIAEINSEMQRANQASGQAGWQQLTSLTSTASSGTGPTVDAFIKHLVGLMRDHQTLYSVYL